MTKFHKVVIKVTGLRDQTPSKMRNFHEQRVITPEGMVGYGPLSYIWDAICRNDSKSAYAISSFSPTGYQPVVMVMHFKRREVIMPGTRRRSLDDVRCKQVA